MAAPRRHLIVALAILTIALPYLLLYYTPLEFSRTKSRFRTTFCIPTANATWRIAETLSRPLGLSMCPTSEHDGYRDEGYDEGISIPKDVNRVTNASLGFDKVFVVGLPERTDKRDAMTLTAALTGFDIEWVDGVRGETIPNKALPYGVDRKKLMETNLGSWRGHMNAIRRILDEGIESSIIMEDDMDWDVRLKPQLEVIAAGTRRLMSRLPDTLFPSAHQRPPRSQHILDAPRSPYGDSWDILWLGHCGELFPEMLDENQALAEGDPARLAMMQKYTILNDATVPPLQNVTGMLDFKAYPEHTRWVHITGAPICSFAYALTQQGARKLLYELSVNHLTGPLDNALSLLCRQAASGWSALLRDPSKSQQTNKNDGDRGVDLKCLSVTPPLFFHHKAKGLASATSDIQDVVADSPKGAGAKGPGENGAQEGLLREQGTTENIVWSVRLNIKNLLSGADMESQF